jgi:hypothetical protein
MGFWFCHRDGGYEDEGVTSGGEEDYGHRRGPSGGTGRRKSKDKIEIKLKKEPVCTPSVTMAFSQLACGERVCPFPPSFFSSPGVVLWSRHPPRRPPVLPRTC